MNQNILKDVFKQEKLDVIISTSDQTRLWYTKINTSAGILFINNPINKNKSTLLIDGRYFELAQTKAQNVIVKLYTQTSLNAFVEDKKHVFKRIGVEEDYLNLKEFNQLKQLFPKTKFVLISGQKLRQIKTNEEIKLISKACQISLKALEELKPMIKPGVSEIDLEIKLAQLLKKHGANKNSFDTIVVSGKRTSLPHGKPSTKKLKNNELVTIDFGALYEGYCSDITRTFNVGKVTNSKLIEISKIITTAQKIGIEAIKPGVTTGEIDEICRSYIKTKGYEKYFVHSTGHGLGIDIHELPNVSSNNQTVLKPGMIITVEPGIYIPTIGGIRIEDDILVTETGFEILSKLNKSI